MIIECLFKRPGNVAGVFVYLKVYGGEAFEQGFVDYYDVFGLDAQHYTLRVIGAWGIL